jgi:arabinose-5-phosphate isomerase
MKKKIIINNAKKVIITETDGIKKLSKILNENFLKILIKLSKVRGKVVFTGIGKSAHIAQKISSTMSSTGTPSQFYHATEMSHGDLGGVSKNDLVIILSNSGNSLELKGVIEFCKENKISIIGISSNNSSYLISSSEMSLVIPNAKEACSVGLAPTTSTSMMLVLGDVICVSLMKIKNFTVKDYRNIHPGGSLGESLLQVKKIMHTGNKIPQINENDSMKNAVLEITRKSFGHVIVTNKSNKIIGIITDGDLRRAINRSLLDNHVNLVMKKNPFVIKGDLLCTEALRLMNEKKISCLFVEHKMKPIGIVHIHDCLKLLKD